MNNFKTGKKFLALVMAILIAFSGLSVYAAEGDNQYPDISVCHDHIFGEWDIKVQPTCKTEGAKYRTCGNCGFTEGPVVIPVDPNGHTPDNGTVIIAPTCVSDGISKYSCTQSGCNVTYQVKVAKLGHDLAEELKVSIEPKHMYMHYSNGRGYRNCNRCGVSVEQTIYVEHDFAGATPDVKKAPTCKEGGYKETKCNICQDVIREDLPADPKAHVFGGKAQLKEGVKFDCKNDGVGIVVCELCNAIDEITIPKEKAHDEEYLGWIIEKELPDDAKCGKYEKKGSEIRFCFVCNTELERRVIDAPHNFIGTDKDGNEISYITAKVASTCCTRGYDLGNCVDCGEKDVQNFHDIDPDGHRYIEKITKPATCSEKGERLVLCKYDASHFKYEETELAEHIYIGQWTIKEATCTQPGYKKNYCEKCGEVNIYLPKDENAHNFSGSNWTITDKSTCSKEGEATATCKDCQIEVTKPVPLCYSTGAGFTTVDPTCYQEGATSYICTKCGTKREIKIPKDDTAHVAAPGYRKIKTATCTETGLETKYCAYCNEDIQENQKLIPRESHTIREVIDEYPQCAIDEGDFKEGSKHHECVDCTYVSESVKIYAEHNFTKWDNKNEPNCLYPVTRERVCYGCGLVEVDDNYYIAHKDAKWTFENGEKCADGGTAVKRCDYCKAVYDTKTILPGDHTDLVFVTDQIESTTTVCYGSVYQCVTCHETVTQTRTHNFMILEKGFEPTCEKAGKTDSKYCMVCKFKIEPKDIEPLGHDKAYDSNGTEYCLRCNLYKVDSSIEGISTCNHFCHNQGIVARVLKMISAFFWKLFKTSHFCKCGVPHYHDEKVDGAYTMIEIHSAKFDKGLFDAEEKLSEIVYSCSECGVEKETYKF